MHERANRPQRTDRALPRGASRRRAARPPASRPGRAASRSRRHLKLLEATAGRLDEAELAERSGEALAGVVLELEKRQPRRLAVDEAHQRQGGFYRNRV